MPLSKYVVSLDIDARCVGVAAKGCLAMHIPCLDTCHSTSCMLHPMITQASVLEEC